MGITELRVVPSVSGSSVRQKVNRSSNRNWKKEDQKTEERMIQ
jgi:hypothetical protein